MIPVRVGSVAIGDGRLVLIAGPCVIESAERTVLIARALAEIARVAGTALVFKASFDKANRTSTTSFRGRGLAAGLEVLQQVKDEVGVPVTTDVHETVQVDAVAEVVDLLQIPAFLCRQTDLLVACGRSSRAVNVKRGPFVAPRNMAHAVDKLRAAGARGVVLTERGSTFGYNDLVVDYRSIVWMRELGVPVVFDATHACQRPGAAGDHTSGDRTLAEPLGAAAVAIGADGVFAEVHDAPDEALSDADTQLPLDGFPAVLDAWLAVHAARRQARKP